MAYAGAPCRTIDNRDAGVAAGKTMQRVSITECHASRGGHSAGVATTADASHLSSPPRYSRKVSDALSI
jgi:hypothetical protein